jgi:hypothetical protein
MDMRTFPRISVAGERLLDLIEDGALRPEYCSRNF